MSSLMSARSRMVTRMAPACSTTHSSVRLPARAAGARASLRQHTAARTAGRRTGRRLRCAAAKQDGAPEESKEPADPPVDVPASTGAEAEEKPMGSLWDDVDAQELEAMLPTPSVAAAAAAEMAVAEAATAAEEKTAVQQFLFPDKEELPNDIEMSIWEHFDELRERVLISVITSGVAILSCFLISKDLVVLLEEPVTREGVRFLQLSPGEYFFTTLKVAGYTGVLLSAPSIIYEVAAFVVPGLTKSERNFLGPIVGGSSVLFYTGLLFSYSVLVPAALKFFVSYADGAVESLWSIDQYFEFVLVLMLSTGLSFQVPVIQLLLGATGVVSSDQMLSAWRYVVVGAVVAAAVLTPSTDPFTQTLLAVPLMGLYFGGSLAVRAVENKKLQGAS